MEISKHYKLNLNYLLCLFSRLPKVLKKMLIILNLKVCVYSHHIVNSTKNEKIFLLYSKITF